LKCGFGTQQLYYDSPFCSHSTHRRLGEGIVDWKCITMTPRNQKLELTWIGKESRPRLKPRILLEDPENS